MGVTDLNTFQIPPLVLGDTFYEWMNVTNNSIIDKLNVMEVYTLSAGDGIGITANDSGLMQIGLASTITKNLTFSGDIIFDGRDGAQVVTINATEISVDDYNIVLGDVEGGGGTADVNITDGGGGGVIVKRSAGPDASLLWHGMTTDLADPQLQDFGIGCSGAWTTTDYINLTGGVGLKSSDSILRFKTGTNATGS